MQGVFYRYIVRLLPGAQPRFAEVIKALRGLTALERWFFYSNFHSVNDSPFTMNDFFAARAMGSSEWESE